MSFTVVDPGVSMMMTVIVWPIDPLFQEVGLVNSANSHAQGGWNVRIFLSALSFSLCCYII